MKVVHKKTPPNMRPKFHRLHQCFLRIQIGHGGLNWRWGQELYSGNNQSQVHSDGGETEEGKIIYSCHLYREGCLGTCFTGFKWKNLDLSSLCLEPKKKQPYQEKRWVRNRGSDAHGLILYSTFPTDDKMEGKFQQTVWHFLELAKSNICIQYTLWGCILILKTL